MLCMLFFIVNMLGRVVMFSCVCRLYVVLVVFGYWNRISGRLLVLWIVL